MGFSESVTHIIMFIAVVTIATSLVFIFNQQISQSASSVAIRQQYLSNQIKTAIEIEAVKYDSGVVTAYVKNIGDSVFYPNRSTVYIDKDRIPFNENMSFSIESDTETKNIGILDSNEVFKIIINKTLQTSETHELLIVTQYNARDVYDFSS